MIHEIEDSLQVTKLNTLQVEQWVLVDILLKDTSEERTTGTQDQFMCLDLFVTTRESYIEKVLFISQLPE